MVIKKKLLFYLIFVFQFNLGLSQEKIEVRELFYRASTSSSATDSLFSKFELIDENGDAFSTAYKGMSQLMVCYHSYNPYKKFKYFVTGKRALENAIKKDSINIEYRFLRLSVQLNTPAFLGYSSDINEDKLAIFNGIKESNDTDLLFRIAEYTNKAKRITEAEKKIIKQALENNKNYKL